MPCIEHEQIGDKQGYGCAKWEGRTTKLHRKVFATSNGYSRNEIEGLVVRHKCDNPRCISPEHLELGTHQDNMNDKVERGRSLKGEASPRSILQEHQVQEIRSTYLPKSRKFGSRALARKYGVSLRAIQQVLLNITWKHV